MQVFFPKYYVLNNKNGIINKSHFSVCCKKWSNSKERHTPSENKIELSKITKESSNYKDQTVPVNDFEQKPMTKKFDFSVPQQEQQQQQQKQVKQQQQQQRQQLKQPAYFLAAKNQIDMKFQIKKVIKKRKKTIRRSFTKQYTKNGSNQQLSVV